MANNRVLKNKNYLITQNYGNNGHLGVDLVGAGHTTDSIIAHSDGTVIFCQTGQVNNKGSKSNLSYGNCIKLKHTNGYYTLYAHLSAVYVTLGAKVKQGQVIGHMGNTGNSYGAHLHFEVFNDKGNRINPRPYLNANLGQSSANTTINNNTTKSNNKKYTTGTYIVTADLLNVRKGAGTNYTKKTAKELTANAREQNRQLGNINANGLLKKCICTVSEVKNNWGKIPSGWICLDYCKKV